MTKYADREVSRQFWFKIIQREVTTEDICPYAMAVDMARKHPLIEHKDEA